MNKILILIGAILLLVGVYSCSESSLKNEGDILPLDPDADNENKLDNDDWAWVGAYPGEVNVLCERLGSEAVIVKGYVLNSSNSSKPKYWQSSGLYLAPAENIDVVVPEGAGNLYYQVGIAGITLPIPIERASNVVKKGDEKLGPGSHKLFNNFGGHLYFYYEGTPTESDITVTVTGAIKSPDYILGQSDIQTWGDEVQDTVTPMIWGELIGKNIAITLPIEELKKIGDPEALLQEYDNLIDDLGRLWGGDFDQVDGIPLWRIYADVQLPGNSVTVPGYPIGLDMKKEEIIKKLINIKEYDSSDAKLIIDELGENYLTPWYSTDLLGSLIPQISTYYLYNKQNKWPMTVANLTENPAFSSFSTYSKLDEKFRLRMLIQLAQQYGWGLYAHVNSSLNDEFKKSLRVGEDQKEMSQQIKNDLFVMAVTEYAGEDLTEFFNYWHFLLTSYGKSYMKTYDSSPASEFWTVFNTNIPEIDKELTPEKHDRGNPMLIIDTLYDPSEWSAYASSSFKNTPASNLIDGKESEYWQNSWQVGTGDDLKYPHHVYFNFDKEEIPLHELEFNYVVMWQRGSEGRPELETKEFQIQILDGDGNWVNVDDDRIFFLSNEDGGQKFFLNTVYKTRGVRIMLLNSHAVADGERNHKTGCILGKVRIGLIN